MDGDASSGHHDNRDGRDGGVTQSDVVGAATPTDLSNNNNNGVGECCRQVKCLRPKGQGWQPVPVAEPEPRFWASSGWNRFQAMADYLVN